MRMASDQLISLLWHVRLSLFPTGELPPTPGLMRDKAEQKFWWLLYIIDLRLKDHLVTGAKWEFTRFGPKDTSALAYRINRVFAGEAAFKVAVKPLVKVIPRSLVDEVDSVLEMWAAFWDYKEYWQVFEMEYPETYRLYESMRQHSYSA